MIDFRYHIVSIVAVLLALSAGVVLGSGLLGGPLLDDVRRRADDVRQDNDELRQLAAERLQRIEQQEDFAVAVRPYLLPGALSEKRVVIFETGSVADSFRDAVHGSIADAGGQIGATIRLTDEFALEGEVKIDELALALGSVSGEPEDLRLEAAATLAARVAAASEVSSGQSEARDRLEELLGDLSSPGFITVEDAGRGVLIPTGAAFVILTGDPEEPRYDAAEFVTRLAAGLGVRGHPVVLGESGDSAWDAVGSVLEDADVAEDVATVTAADTPGGAIALALTLRAAIDGEVGHRGIGSEPDAILPSPATSPAASPSP